MDFFKSNPRRTPVVVGIVCWADWVFYDDELAALFDEKAKAIILNGPCEPLACFWEGKNARKLPVCLNGITCALHFGQGKRMADFETMNRISEFSSSFWIFFFGLIIKYLVNWRPDEKLVGPLDDQRFSISLTHHISSEIEMNVISLSIEEQSQL